MTKTDVIFGEKGVGSTGTRVQYGELICCEEVALANFPCDGNRMMSQ